MHWFQFSFQHNTISDPNQQTPHRNFFPLVLHGACTERVVLTDSLSGLGMLCWCWQESLVTDSKYWPVHHFDPLSTLRKDPIYLSDPKLRNIYRMGAFSFHRQCHACIDSIYCTYIASFLPNHLIINNTTKIFLSHKIVTLICSVIITGCYISCFVKGAL